MYGHSVSAAGLSGAGVSSATLAATGYNTLAFLLAAVTLILAGLALTQLVRRPGRARP
jgi:hypothetical protein